VISNSETASTITQINGVDAAAYVTDLGSKVTGYQDKDAAYNTMFYSLGQHSAHRSWGRFTQGGRNRFLYPGSHTTFLFANGSDVTLQNTAMVTAADMTGVVDGQSYYDKFCNPNGMTPIKSNTAKNETTLPTPVSAPPTIPGYPSPIAITSDKVASCYYLNGKGYDDVVVISILDFIADSLLEFQRVIQECIASSVRAGKTKLVLDLQANGGGYIVLANVVFRQLFPSIQEDSLSRWKETTGFLAAAEIVSGLVADLDSHNESDSALDKDWRSSFNYRYDLNSSGQPFVNFDEKFGPHTYQNTNYTSLLRWSRDDYFTRLYDNSSSDPQIAGNGSLISPSQPFQSKNIILLYDGTCASSCSLISDMLRNQAGVQSISMGGRPIEGLTQGVGGVKGSQTLHWAESEWLQHPDNRFWL